jgi:hypothetical protein
LKQVCIFFCFSKITSFIFIYLSRIRFLGCRVILL